MGQLEVAAMHGYTLVERLADELFEQGSWHQIGDETVREFDLAGPLLLSEICLARALINRLSPGQCTVLRSRWQETHRDIIHLCNVLGHELVEAGYDGVHYMMKVRVRGAHDRVPRQDPMSIDYPEPRPMVTLDISPRALTDPRTQALSDDNLASRLLSWFR